MVYILLSLFLFITTVFCHVILHRFLVTRQIRTYKTIYIFGLGFLLTFGILVYFSYNLAGGTGWDMQIPITGSIIYALLSFLFYIYFGNAYLGEDSPSARIFFHLEKGPKSYEEIISYFSDETLIIKRVRNLKDAGLVREEKGRYKATTRGKFMMSIFEIYRKLLSWDKGG